MAKTPTEGLEVEFERREAAERRSSERTSKAAQRRIKQKFAGSGRLRSGAAAKLSEDIETEIRGGLETRLGVLTEQKQSQEREERIRAEDRELQDRLLTLQEKTQAEDIALRKKEFVLNEATNLTNRIFLLISEGILNPDQIDDALRVADFISQAAGGEGGGGGDTSAQSPLSPTALNTDPGRAARLGRQLLRNAGQDTSVSNADAIKFLREQRERFPGHVANLGKDFGLDVRAFLAG